MAISVGIVLSVLAAFGSVTSGGVLRAAETEPQVLPEKIVFDGFDLDLRPGRTSVAKALRGLPADEGESAAGLPVELVVKGPPSSRAGSGAMSAEVEQQFAFLNIAAGVLADRWNWW